MQSEIIVEGYRVSVQQERLWRLCEEYGESNFRSACAMWLPSGAVSTAALERSLVGLLSRHESLRTSFRRLAALAAPLQCVLDDVQLEDVARRLLEFTSASELLAADDAAGLDKGDASLMRGLRATVNAASTSRKRHCCERPSSSLARTVISFA
jgi:hypothetical protein